MIDTQQPHTRLKENGFTLVEAIITLALLGLLAAGTMTLGSLVQNSLRTSEAKNYQFALEKLILERISNPSTCLTTIGGSLNTLGAPLAPSSSYDIRMHIPFVGTGASGTSNILAANEVIPAMKLTVKNLRLADFHLVSSNRYVANLHLLLGHENVDTPMRETKISALKLEVDSLNQITSCQVFSSGVGQQACEDMGCVFDPGTSPMCQCGARDPTSCTDPSHFPVSFNAAGVPTCQPLGGATCANPNEFAVGLGLNRVDCAPLPAGPASDTCLPTRIGSCDLPLTANGGTAGDCSSGHIGTCLYTCASGTWTPAAADTCTPDVLTPPPITGYCHSSSCHAGECGRVFFLSNAAPCPGNQVGFLGPYRRWLPPPGVTCAGTSSGCFRAGTGGQRYSVMTYTCTDGQVHTTNFYQSNNGTCPTTTDTISSPAMVCPSGSTSNLCSGETFLTDLCPLSPAARDGVCNTAAKRVSPNGPMCISLSAKSIGCVAQRSECRCD